MNMQRHDASISPGTKLLSNEPTPCFNTTYSPHSLHPSSPFHPLLILSPSSPSQPHRLSSSLSPIYPPPYSNLNIGTPPQQNTLNANGIGTSLSGKQISREHPEQSRASPPYLSTSLQTRHPGDGRRAHGVEALAAGDRPRSGVSLRSKTARPEGSPKIGATPLRNSPSSLPFPLTVAGVTPVPSLSQHALSPHLMQTKSTSALRQSFRARKWRP
jgi:hypothetical protein